MIIAVDFDGTLVEHRFPEVGRPVPGAFKWLSHLQAMGAKIILFTMRSDREGEPYLTHAVDTCKANGIELFGVNENPTQESWTTSPKPYAHVYVDDAALGCPLKDSAEMGARPFVDWDVVGPWLEKLTAVKLGHTSAK